MWISEYKFAKQALMLLFLILPFFTYAEQKRGEWSSESCAEIYKAIGFFTYQADNYWKKKDEKKAAFLRQNSCTSFSETTTSLLK